MSDPTFDYLTFLSHLTAQPGVYQMYDAEGAILYVGKAKNLKNRVSSYFVKTGQSLKTQALVKRITRIEVTVAGSEIEALVLEHNLIKAQKPPFNILFRDDKSYPFIFLSTEDEYPKLAFHRGAKKKKGRYFGPYPNAAAVRESLNLLQKTFKVRQCEEATFRNRSRPCLMHQINRCSAPCVQLIDSKTYADDVDASRLFLEGKNSELKDRLQHSMQEASDALASEQAAEYRDRLAMLQQLQSEQRVEVGAGNMDVIACEMNNALACVHVIYIRAGRIIGSRSYFPKDKLEQGAANTLAYFLSQKYLSAAQNDVPQEIILNCDIPDQTLLAEVISRERGSKVTITARVKSHKARWLSMAVEAAKQNLKQKLNSQSTLRHRYQALQDVLALDDIPQRMECFDISHSSGEYTVASCVVFDSNGPRKSDYRRFKIEGIQAGDDYAAMKQVLTRRYSRLQKEAQRLPDLVIVDGGKGQLTQAHEVLSELGVHSSLLVGIAKGPTRKAGWELLHFIDGTEMDLEADHPALHLLQHIRDEAHRFAVAGHVSGRDKARQRSTLENIPGIGAKRRKALLSHFGGLAAVIQASQNDLAKVPGISKNMAEQLYNILHSE